MSGSIPRFLIPRGMPSPATFRALSRRSVVSARLFSSSPPAHNGPPRVLEKPDKFRPPSHASRRVVQTKNGRIVSQPLNYPGPKLSEKEIAEREAKQYPNTFPPPNTVMFKFLTNKWIHIWIAMGVLTSLATFTFTTNFKRSSPFAHLLPPWSGLLSHPIDTISQAVSVFKMDVQHNSVLVREQRHKRVEDAEKRRQFRVAHGLEEGDVPATTTAAAAAAAVDDQSPIAQDQSEFVDWEGKKKPVKKWLGIW
ncbi:hypothetical protein ASPZODRAFT_15873 [Penicilliopsis zonata CBS 506.65]|uniref:Uncharacterized protein n=1 Tax=Penicilliopsis zonata CBS 506.65 TaxID=1073090 RepID=A0A1L9SJC8_9EURO|nr:hypothetical protein ASPZODRAFT_15873 [Penicilliopsis zonata CBS 506.65]OJJ47193.1 hypothetical protein ASPZODRAFT_15873 [Penicilliopsis zonata CBS 506.65]